jgi:DNA-binding GntR family transcriptional regulator
MLQRQGLVTSSPRRGTFVTRLSRADALDLGYNRALLEGHAVRVGFANLGEPLFASLESLIAAMRLCNLPQDTPRLIQLDLAFHRLLVEAAGSPRLLELWSNLNGQVRALYLTTLENERADIAYVIEFHRQLLAALRSGDPQAAQRAVFEHYVRRDRDAQQLDLLDETADAMAEFMLGPLPGPTKPFDDQTGALS